MILECGDCLEMMKTLPEQSIDMVITSPPYDNLRDYKGYSFDFENIAKQLFRVVKVGGVIVWIVSDATINGSETGTSFRQALFFKEIGFNIHDTMIWKKDSCSFPESNRYYPNFEYMFVFSKGSPKTFNPLKDRKNKYAGNQIHGTFRNKDGTTTYRSETWKNTICGEYGIRFNVWDQPSEKNNKTGHPAVFPLKLVKDHIYTWTNKGDVVMDPFMGSGTTGIACKEMDREFIGFEISKDYFDVAKNRITQHSFQMTFENII